MRTKEEIYDMVHKAMYDAMYAAWDTLSEEEKNSYRLNMHGLEMYVSTKKQSK